MQLQTERLTLVPLGPQFLDSTYEYAGKLENTKFMINFPTFDLEETMTYLEKVQTEWAKEEPEFYEFAMLLSGVHIGMVGIYKEDEQDEVELGWILNQNYWGKGYVVEAAKELIRYSVEELKATRIIAHCDSENVNSYKVMEKLGMKFIEKTGGRKNKSSDEEREDLLYVLELE